jgi:hypothetical protein
VQPGEQREDSQHDYYEFVGDPFRGQQFFSHGMNYNSGPILCKAVAAFFSPAYNTAIV